MSIKKQLTYFVMAVSLICFSSNAKSSATEDAAKFAKRIDDTTILLNTITQYSNIADEIAKALDKFNNDIKDADVDDKIDDKKLLIDTAKLQENTDKIKQAIKITNELKKTANDLKQDFDKIDASSSNYSKNVETLDKKWNESLSSAQKEIADKYNAFPQNINIYSIEGLSGYISQSMIEYDEFNNLYRSNEAKISDNTKEKVEKIKKDFIESLSDASTKLETSNDAFEESFNLNTDSSSSNTSSSGTSESNNNGDGSSSGSTSSGNDSNKDKTDTSKASDTKSTAEGLTTKGLSYSAPSSDQRTPYCSRSAGLAGMGGGTSGGNNASDPNVTGNSEASGPTNPAACPDIVNIYDALRLKEKGLNFNAFLNAMKGFNVIKPSNGKLGILDFTQPSNRKRFYLLNLKDLKNPILMAQEKVSHGSGGGSSGSGSVSSSAYGASILMSNSNNSNLSSIGFVKSAENYISSKGWPAKLDSKGSNGKRIVGYEPGYNSNVLSRGVVMHSSSGSWADFSPRSWGCMMFNPSVAKLIINDYVGVGTLLYTHNVAPADYFKNSRIINGNHNIPNTCN
ncbi:MAG: hypothetical protein BWY78_00198 [Alphaproteobacteria bacterium ADurb.Bin438]|nr:MAG: hypothetical protein BWY78_00198 [Alphaproteobacteria bacterium ADurb.Bin438]